VAHRRFLLCQAVPDDEDLGLTVWYAGERDRSQRARILGDLGLDWEAECALRDAAEAEAVRLVSQQWEAIVNVASALAQQGRLEQADVRRIIEAG